MATVWIAKRDDLHTALSTPYARHCPGSRRGVAFTAAYLITDHELEEILDTQLSLHSRIVAGQLDPNATIDDYARLASHLGLPEYPAQLYRDGIAVPVNSPESSPKLYHEEELKLVLGFGIQMAHPGC
ncbi:hypothetical protein HSBAA_PA_0600 (plasmid) [Vreelandella sulfidaeris]|uniref:Uncharacterized protein n=1 Tax=Vreelandella sulfidaeris TaxID=115553 RepID=A0A455UI74_9GAMM|nr:hypothetical protein HSBAA_PA_0600 [Halomonas sulfidaeris]